MRVLPGAAWSKFGLFGATYKGRVYPIYFPNQEIDISGEHFDKSEAPAPTERTLRDILAHQATIQVGSFELQTPSEVGDLIYIRTECGKSDHFLIVSGSSNPSSKILNQDTAIAKELLDRLEGDVIQIRKELWTIEKIVKSGAKNADV